MARTTRAHRTPALDGAALSPGGPLTQKPPRRPRTSPRPSSRLSRAGASSAGASTAPGASTSPLPWPRPRAPATPTPPAGSCSRSAATAPRARLSAANSWPSPWRIPGGRGSGGLWSTRPRGTAPALELDPPPPLHRPVCRRRPRQAGDATSARITERRPQIAAVAWTAPPDYGGDAPTMGWVAPPRGRSSNRLSVNRRQRVPAHTSASTRHVAAGRGAGPTGNQSVRAG